MPSLLPYEVTVHVTSVELNRNVEDKFLPIDAIKLQILSDLIELKSKNLKTQGLFESDRDQKFNDQKNDEDEKSLESVDVSDAQPSTSQRTSTDDSQNLNDDESNSIDDENSLSQHPKIASSKISFNLNSSTSDRVFNKKVTLIASGILKKHERVKFNRNIKDFGSGGISLTSSPDTLTDWLERKPFRYDIIKDGEVIASAVHKMTRAFIAQIAMRGFKSQETTVKLDLKKLNGVNAGSILVRIKLSQKSKPNKYGGFGRHSLAASILKW